MANIMSLAIALAAIILSLTPSARGMKPTVLDAIRCDKTFGTLKAAIAKAELSSALRASEANITLFAPTNSAFQSLGISSAELPDSSALADILKYHVVPGKAFSADLQDGAILPTLLENADIEISIDGEDSHIEIFVDGENNAAIIYEDMETMNGIVHVIDKVLIPPVLAEKNEGEDISEMTQFDGMLVKDGSEVPILG